MNVVWEENTDIYQLNQGDTYFLSKPESQVPLHRIRFASNGKLLRMEMIAGGISSTIDDTHKEAAIAAKEREKADTTLRWSLMDYQGKTYLQIQYSETYMRLVLDKVSILGIYFLVEYKYPK